MLGKGGFCASASWLRRLLRHLEHGLKDCYLSPECWPTYILCDSDSLTSIAQGSTLEPAWLWPRFGTLPATTWCAFHLGCQSASACQWPRADFSCLLFLAFLITDHLSAAVPSATRNKNQISQPFLPLCLHLFQSPGHSSGHQAVWHPHHNLLVWFGLVFKAGSVGSLGCSQPLCCFSSASWALGLQAGATHHSWPSLVFLLAQ